MISGQPAARALDWEAYARANERARNRARAEAVARALWDAVPAARNAGADPRRGTPAPTRWRS